MWKWGGLAQQVRVYSPHPLPKEPQAAGDHGPKNTLAVLLKPFPAGPVGLGGKKSLPRAQLQHAE